MKSMLRLALSLLNELGKDVGISTALDEITLTKRCQSEGLSFITITLPGFEKELMLHIANLGYDPSIAFSGFRKRNGTPEFLGGFLSILFDENGQYRYPVVPEDWDYQSRIIGHLRQFLLLTSKVNMDCTEDRIKNAMRSYIDTDIGLPELPESLLSSFAKMTGRILGSFLSDVESCLWRDFSPSYSSGALATRESYNARFASQVWTERLERVFPHSYDLVVNYRDQLSKEVQILDRASETPSKVVHVPKTMKTPRIIAEEPVYNAYAQQGILKQMNLSIRKKTNLALFEGFGWKYQEWNRLLAQIGSENGKLATIDLSEASDRVTAQLVFDGLLRDHQFLSQAVSACRSERANVQGENIVLNKFASMGSALTFPIESMIFYIIVHLAWERAYGSLTKALTPEDGVRVYGDDIIVPVSLVPTLVSLLESYGLKVNIHKSFSGGFFRESCGSDWYAGRPVSPVRLRAPLPNQRHDAKSIVKAIEFHNHLYNKGWYVTAGYVAKTILAQRFVPYGDPNTYGLHLHSNDESLYRTRFNPILQRTELYSLRAREVKPSDSLDGYGALRKFFRSRFEDREPEHLLRDGRSQCVGLNTGWVPLGQFQEYAHGAPLPNKQW